MEEKRKNYEEEIRILKETNEQERKAKSAIQQEHDRLLLENTRYANLNEKLEEKERVLTDEKEKLLLTVEKITREHDLLKEKTRDDSTKMEQLKKELNEKQTECKGLEEEANKYRSFNGRKYHNNKLFLREDIQFSVLFYVESYSTGNFSRTD